MGTKANRDSGISYFVGDLLEKEGLGRFEKWYDHLQLLTPGEKVTDSAVRDKMLEEILPQISEGNSLILGKKDIQMVEEILNRFLKKSDLLK